MDGNTRGGALGCDAAGHEGSATVPKKTRRRRARPGVPAAGVTVHGDTGAAAQAHEAPTPDDIHQRIGRLTRTLHEALRELGYDKELAGTREQLPDARDRLAYIARVTGDAAEKVLNAVDRARSVQQELTRQAGDLHRRWQAVAAFAAGAPERATPAGRALVDETCEFFAGVEAQADRTNAILTDIMLAQDFHDLTGQVIRKVVALAQTMEEQLVRLLLETTPPAQRARVDAAHDAPAPGGPVVNPAGRTDVVTDQAQVDELLASLGF